MPLGGISMQHCVYSADINHAYVVDAIQASFDNMQVCGYVEHVVIELGWYTLYMHAGNSFSG